MRTAGRPDALTATALTIAVLLAVWPSGRLAAQDSQFGIRGLGTPGRQESVRARGTGGAFAPFDPFSPLLDASAADIRRIGASVTGGTSWRTASLDGTETSLRGTRFPALVIAGPIMGRLVLAGGFGSYLDRSFGISTRDTMVLRGEPEAFTDEIRSDGGVADLRLAAAARLGRHVAIGLGLHRITGSTRVSATRRFEDSTSYRTSTTRDEVAYGAWGGSASALLDFGPYLRVAAWFRSDSRLRAEIRDSTTTLDDLPVSFGGGVRWAGSRAALAGAVTWQRWGARGPCPTRTTRSPGRSAPSSAPWPRRCGSACAAVPSRSASATRPRSSPSPPGTAASSRAAAAASTSASSAWTARAAA
ncbi:MAG: hypothetical protein ACREMN_01915 [Gemmatimonadales bacterium]